MEKLRKLLNEYYPLDEWEKEYYIKDSSIYVRDYGDCFFIGHENFTLNVISKRFWFIEWLVEKDIIDYYKVGEIVDTYKWSLREKAYVVSDCVVESMLMILSIQDSPIDFLASILK